MEKSYRKCAVKASATPLFNFGHCMQEIVFRIRYFERGLSKNIKKVNYFFFWSQSLLVTKLSKTKGAWSYWTVGLQVMKQVQKNSFISYTLPEQVWWYNIERFLSYSKNYICKFMKTDSWHHELFYFHLSLWIWKA